MSKLITIMWDGLKNATFVFFVFYFLILVVVTLNNVGGLSLMFKVDTYINTLKHPLALICYLLILAVSIFNSYKKFAQ